jgi:hypothetical protein
MEPGRASGNGIESGRNDVLCRNVIHQQQHPGSERFERGQGLSETCSGRSEFLHFVPVNTFDQLIARWKMTIKGTCSDARLLRDFLQAGICALPGKGRLCHLKNALAVAQRVCARFPGDCRTLLRHHQNSCIRRVSPVIY